MKNTAITFELEVPSVFEFEERMTNVLKRYPYLVMEEQKEIIGYAYASPLNARQAYDWSCEISIYLDPSYTKKRLRTSIISTNGNDFKRDGDLKYLCLYCFSG